MSKFQNRIEHALDLSEMVYTVPSDRVASEKVLFSTYEGVLWIAIAGTDDLKDLFEDMDIDKKKIDLLQGHILVHEGFWSSWVQIREIVIKKITEERPNEIQFTGHSKGGAMALCAYLDLPYILPQTIDKLAPPLVFGCPRVLASSSISQLNRVERPYLFVNQGDPIPKLPREYMGFETWGNIEESESPWWQRIYLLRAMVHKLDTYRDRFYK